MFKYFTASWQISPIVSIAASLTASVFLECSSSPFRDEKRSLTRWWLLICENSSEFNSAAVMYAKHWATQLGWLVSVPNEPRRLSLMSVRIETGRAVQRIWYSLLSFSSLLVNNIFSWSPAACLATAEYDFMSHKTAANTWRNSPYKCNSLIWYINWQKINHKISFNVYKACVWRKTIQFLLSCL